MENNTIGKKQIDAIVVGLDNLDVVKEAIEKRIVVFNHKYKQAQTKQKIKRILLFFLGVFELGAVILLSLLQNSTSSALTIFIIGFGFVVLTAVFMIMPNTKLIQEKYDADELPKYVNYINKQKEAFNILLANKHQLVDVYLKSYRDNWILYFVVLVKDENDFEEAKQYDIYIDNLKINKEGKYTTFTIEYIDEKRSRYQLSLELTQETYEKIIVRN